MTKTSIDYAEISGLTHTIEYLQAKKDPTLQSILEWLIARKRELQNK